MNAMSMLSPWWEREDMVGKKPFLLKVRKDHENGHRERNCAVEKEGQDEREDEAVR